MRVSREVALESEALAVFLAAKVQERKARDVRILDLRGRVDYTDLLLLCTARSTRQAKAIAAGLRKVAKTEHQQLPLSVEGQTAGRWVLVDYGDVVVHIFEEAMRGFYDLDGLWADATSLVVPEVEPIEDEGSLLLLP
jgi:ribosome-associated protein